MKRFNLFSLSMLLLLSINLGYALPFSVVPKDGTSLPTTVAPNGTAIAYYTVSNNTTHQLNGNFVKYFPPNVRQTNDEPGLCGTSFDLAPRDAAGSSCDLKLLISGPVSANDSNPRHHLFVCAIGGATCAGTPFPLNVSVSSSAVTLFGTTGEGGDPDNVLFTIDPNTAATNRIMNLTSNDGAVIASNGVNLYHWTGQPLQTFERINLNNLTLTNIPFSGDPILEVLAAGFMNNTFLVGDLIDNFFSFTPSGTVTDIGTSGNVIRGMACFNHRLYALLRMTGEILEIDPANGNILSSTPLILPGFIVDRGLGLTVNPETGQFYGLVRVSGSQVRRLIKVDVTTGIGTMVGPLNDSGGDARFASIAFHPADPTC